MGEATRMVDANRLLCKQSDGKRHLKLNKTIEIFNLCEFYYCFFDRKFVIITLNYTY